MAGKTMPIRGELPYVDCEVRSIVAFLLLAGFTKATSPRSDYDARIQKRTYDFKEAAGRWNSPVRALNYDKEKKSPLMIALHGLHQSAWIMRYPS